MISRRITALVAVSFAAASAAAQSNDSLPDVASLRAPATPAFILLGVSPTTVSRPQTPSDVSLGFANKSALSTVPQDIALEIAPYWMLKLQRDLTWHSDAGMRNPLVSLMRTAALSTATASKEDATPASTGLGVGGRAMLVSGWLTPETQRKLWQLDSALAADGHIFNKYRLTEINALEASQKADLDICDLMSQAAIAGCKAAVVDKYKQLRAKVDAGVRANPAYVKEVEAARKASEDFSLAREGPMWEVAWGQVWNFADGIWNQRSTGTSAVWSTFSWENLVKVLGASGTPVVVARYSKDTTADPGLRMLDLGVRGVLSSPRFAFSGELVHRKSNGTAAPAGQNRYSGMLEYKLREESWLFAAIGKEYEEANKDSFLTRFGVSFSLKKERYKKD